MAFQYYALTFLASSKILSLLSRYLANTYSIQRVLRAILKKVNCFKHSLSKGLIFLVFLLLVGILLAKYYQKKPIKDKNSSLKNPQELLAQPQKTEIHSSDGTMTLKMSKKLEKNQSLTYSFFTAPLSGKDTKEQLLFTRTLGSGSEMSILPNSWSPDRKYVFLKEKDKNGNLNFLVLKASGEFFSNNEQYLDVGILFIEKKTRYNLYDATGWASPTFLNIMTVNDASKKGPSYWFDIDARAFWGHQ